MGAQMEKGRRREAYTKTRTSFSPLRYRLSSGGGASWVGSSFGSGSGSAVCTLFLSSVEEMEGVSGMAARGKPGPLPKSVSLLQFAIDTPATESESRRSIADYLSPPLSALISSTLWHRVAPLRNSS
jgi:hypothetical protein